MALQTSGLFSPFPQAEAIALDHPATHRVLSRETCPADFLLQEALLRDAVCGRRSDDLRDVVRSEEMRRHEGLRSLGLPTLDYPLAPTCFGRYFSVLEGLDQLLPERPRRIAEVGGGIILYRHSLRFSDSREGVLAFLQQERGVTTLMGSPEPLELAVLAGEGGIVELLEMDERVLKVHASNRREGIFVSILEPALLSENDLLQEALERDVKRSLLSPWVRYVKKMEVPLHDHVETFSVPSREGGTETVGDLITLKASVTERVRPVLVDATLVPLSGGYDLFWAAAAYPHNPPLLWLASLVKAVDALKVGGLLVTDNFDEESDYLPRETFLGLMAHAGLEGVLVRRPFQKGFVKLAVLRKVRETSPWIQEKMGILREVGIA